MNKKPTIRDFVRIMVVEDEDYLRDVICDAIEHLGIRHVHQAADGTEALTKSDQIHPDLVFCDIQMEPMGGLEYLRKLRQSVDPDVACIPVIFLTATTDEKTVRQAKELGVNGFLAKPPRSSTIKETINRVLDNQVV